MPIVTLFNLYRSFIQGEVIQHTDLIAPVMAYSQENKVAPSSVVAALQTMYQHKEVI